MRAVILPGAPRGCGDAETWRRSRWSPRLVLTLLGLLVVASFVVAATSGAYAIAPARVGAILLDLVLAPGQAAQLSVEHLVFIDIRLPRLLLGMATGAALGIAGALMQGIFRNPLADPSLVGVSSGAALAAALWIVVGAWWFPTLPRLLGSWTLVLCAFFGALAVSALTYAIAQVQGTTRLAVMLLAGIAVNALAAALLGGLSQLATDAQLRALQVWLFGSLGGARWEALALVGAIVVLSTVIGLRQAAPLNALALGEAQAHALGVPVEKVKLLATLVVALAVGAVTAVTGIVGFIGLVAPHLVRMAAGPDHRIVIPGAALLGAALVLIADTVARTAVPPAELPLGVLTALIGTPVFLALLLRMRTRT